MRYEPRLYREEDGSRQGFETPRAFGIPASPLEPDLPPELATLAQELGRHADLLAIQYPAALDGAALTGATQVAAGRSRWWMRIAGGLAAAALLIGWGVWQHAQQPGATNAVSQPVALSPTASSAAAVAKLPKTAGRDRADSALLAHSTVQEVGIEAAPRSSHGSADEVEMLHIQVNAFEKVIQRLQDELAARKQSEAETAKLIQSLRQEIDELHKRSDER